MRKPTAFVIDDQDSLIMLYEDTLRLVGCDVITAKDGLEAINKLELHDAPTFIVLDVNLPHLSGRDVLRHLHKHEKYNETPVLIATANSLMAAELESELTENDMLMLKPLGMRDLQQFAKDAIAKQQQSARAENWSQDASIKADSGYSLSFHKDETVPSRATMAGLAEALQAQKKQHASTDSHATDAECGETCASAAPFQKSSTEK